MSIAARIPFSSMSFTIASAVSPVSTSLVRTSAQLTALNATRSAIASATRSAPLSPRRYARSADASRTVVASLTIFARVEPRHGGRARAPPPTSVPRPQPLLLPVEQHAGREVEALQSPPEIALAAALGESLRVHAGRKVLRPEAFAVVVGQDDVEPEGEACRPLAGRALLLEGGPR